MKCEHNNTHEISRITLNLGVSGVVTWVKHQCEDCGTVTVDRIVSNVAEPTPPPFSKKRKKNKKSAKI